MSLRDSPWEFSEDALKNLASWWQNRMCLDGPDLVMSDDVYETLVAR